jgi:hypothetical protein
MPVVNDIPYYGGKTFFVDYKAGSDSGVMGGRASSPWKTLDCAYAHMVSGRGDVVCVNPESVGAAVGTTSGGFQVIPYAASDFGLVPTSGAGAVWHKDKCHIHGLTPYGGVNGRASIREDGTAALTAATSATTMFTVSGYDCCLSNITLYHGNAYAGAQIAMLVSGPRLTLHNVEVKGGAAASSTYGANNAGTRSLKVAAGEFAMYGGKVGLDTTDRGAAMAEIEMASSAARCRFHGVTVETHRSAVGGAGALFVKVGASGIDRYVMFKDCEFINSYQAGGLVLNQGFSIDSNPGGSVILRRSQVMGVTKLETSSNGFLWVDGVGGAATGGLMIVNTG